MNSSIKMDNFNINNICPVCGYDKLDFKPYDEQGNASFEICPCCGFEFGCDDFPDKQKSFVEWRKKWIENGCNWFSRNPAPQDWNAKEQIDIFFNKNIDSYKI